MSGSPQSTNCMSLMQWLPVCIAAAAMLFGSPHEVRGAEGSVGEILLRPEINSGPRFNLEASVNASLKNYPTVAEYESRAKATSGEIALVKTTYLPKIDLFVQELRGSTNNVLGILFPPLSIPQVTGQAEAPRSFKSVWASNASAFMSWEAFDFGLRHSQVMEARTAAKRADAATVLTKFQVACRAADSFFALVAAEEQAKAQQAALERLKVFALTVHRLVDTDLKPGVDASRVDAEVAIAEDDLISAEQTREIRRATLAEHMGLAGTYVESVHGALLMVPPGNEPIFRAQSLDLHPLALHQDAEVKTVHAQFQVLKRTWYPKFYFESAIFSRGSGAQFNRSVARLGYLPNIPNWAVGIKAQFPLMDYFEIKAKERIVANRERAEQSKYAAVMQTLKGDDARAKAMIEGATRLAANAPKLLKAAQDTELRARTRYGVGLANINDVALAEKLLIQAQVTNYLAGLAVWRSYLAAAEAHGDLNPFLRMVSSAPSGSPSQTDTLQNPIINPIKDTTINPLFDPGMNQLRGPQLLPGTGGNEAGKLPALPGSGNSNEAGKLRALPGSGSSNEEGKMPALPGSGSSNEAGKTPALPGSGNSKNDNSGAPGAPAARRLLNSNTGNSNGSKDNNSPVDPTPPSGNPGGK